jgi:hypothetical protein
LTFGTGTLRRIARRWLPLALAALPCGLANAATTALPDEAPGKNLLGMNVWFINDWDGSLAFVDAMKHARPWKDAHDWQKPVAGTDAQGWPTADASTVVFTGTPEQANGTYRLVFNGQADVSLLWANGAVGNKRFDRASNTTTADVSINLSGSKAVSGGLVLRKTRRTPTSAGNSGFTNLRLYRPGYPADGSAVFTKPFLKALAKVQVVRMMDWATTNNNLAQHWEQRMAPRDMNRPGPAYQGMAGRTWDKSDLGVALEFQIALCNTLRTDCWINIPVVADETYVRNMALALRYGTDGSQPYTSAQPLPAFAPLAPGLRLYVEYANEIWNSAEGFDCFYAVQDRVAALPESHPVQLPAVDDKRLKLWRYPAWRMAGISDVFRKVFGDAAMMNRVRPVLMTQQGDAQSTLSTPLKWLDAYAQQQKPARSVASYLYGAGGSGYYWADKALINKADRDAYFAAGKFPPAATVRGIGRDAVWAANYGLKRIAYEGGPSLDDYPDPAARALNLDPRMQQAVAATHDAWSAQGGDLLVYYALRGPSRWEFTPDLANLATPKMQALDQLNTRPRVPVGLGPALPGTLVATEQGEFRARTGAEYIARCDGQPCVGGNSAGNWMTVVGHSASPFAGNLRVNGLSNGPSTLAIWVNGVHQGQLSLPANSRVVDSAALPVAIPAGLVVVRVEVLKGDLKLRAVSVT